MTSPGAGSNDTTEQCIVFFHPDLGIGGAERLIIDTAVGLQKRGHRVTIFTSHCDLQHCFEEARDGTLDVRVRGHTIFPTTVLNRFHILLATLRQIHLVLAIAVLSDELKKLQPTIFLPDQLAACVPLLRWLFPSKERIIFYCHFPDQLLAQRNGGFLGLVKTIYRFPFDWFEGWSMSASDLVIVNSHFTQAVARRTFPSLNQRMSVIYPCVDVQSSSTAESRLETPLWSGIRYLLSINRFERKKSVALAIYAYHGLKSSERASTRLVIAGGYDLRVPENVQYHNELVSLAESLGLSTATAKTVPTALSIPSSVNVLFLLSIPGPFKSTLLSGASLLVYTPTNEHFGIVPVEAMQHGVPVLATDTGGPLETVIDGSTGWLRDPDKVEEWTEVVRKALDGTNAAELVTMGKTGQKRVREKFTQEIMAGRFEEEFRKMLTAPRLDFIEWRDILLAVGIFGLVVAGLTNFVLRRVGGACRIDSMRMTAEQRRLRSLEVPRWQVWDRD